MRTEKLSIHITKIAPILIPCAIVLLALTYRIYGLFDNHPFWVDEFSSANQARLMLAHGIAYFGHTQLNVEYNNILSHILIALSFAIFGEHIWAARLPFAVIGSLVPVATYVLAQKVFNRTIAVSASLFAISSYFLIAWSRQARGYVILQLFVLLTIYLYIHLNGQIHKKILIVIMSILSIIGGILTHLSFTILPATLLLHHLITHRTISRAHIAIVLVCAAALVIISTQGFFSFSTLTFSNNLWYYHSFLWREYGLITFLALIGFLGTVYKRAFTVSLICLYIAIHLAFFTFVFGPYSSRYILVIFPLMYIGAAFSLYKYAHAAITRGVVVPQNYLASIVTIFLTMFIIANGHKFDVKPNTFYSVNHDFREIALIDYDAVYTPILAVVNESDVPVAVIDTWHDRLYWYLGTDYPAPYLFRWADDPLTTNGLARRTDFAYNDAGEKIIPRQKNLRFISELSDLKRAMAQYSKGFIFIDDATLPADVIAYTKEHMHQEMYLDHYPLDDNPYSIWPATLYSWGIHTAQRPTTSQ